MTVQCSICQNGNEDGSKFCIHCGNSLITGTVEGVNIQQSETPSSVETEIQNIRKFMTQLAGRITALEIPVAAVSRSPRIGHSTIDADIPHSVQELSSATARSLGPTPTTTPSRPVIFELEPSDDPGQGPGGRNPSRFDLGSNIDWERVLGLNWLAIIGAISLTVGVGFFLRLSFDNDWIGETGRVALGMIVGAGFMAVAEYTHRRYPPWAQAVTGGGAGILYLSIYAAFGFYELIDPIPALIFLGLVALVSGVQALRYESMSIALLGIFGAFLTPVLLGKDLDPDQRLWVLAYILVVDLGILAIASFRNWRGFTLLGLLGSYGLFGMWIGQVPDSDLVVAQVGLTGIFLIFVGSTTLFHMVWKRAPEAPDMSLIIFNALAYYGFTFGLLWDQYEGWFGVITLSMSLFYGFVGYAAIARSGASPLVALFALATALVFLTIAMPLQLSGEWITLAWAAQGTILIWVGFTLSAWQTRAFGLSVLGLAAFRLLLLDTPVDLTDFEPVLNGRFATFAVGIGAAYVSAYLYWRKRNRLQHWEKSIFMALIGAANLLTIWILSTEVIAYFDSRSPQLQGLIRDAESAQLLSLTVLWALYGLVALAVVIGRTASIWRWVALSSLSLVAFKSVFVDTFAVKLNLTEFNAALNISFATSALVIGVITLTLFLYRKEQRNLTVGERFVIPSLLVLINFMIVWMLSTEIVRYFDSRLFLASNTLSDLESAKHLSLTVVWAMYGVVVIAAGIIRRSSIVRLVGIGLLALAVTKLFIFDVFLLEEGYRVTAFFTLGVILLLTGLAYQKYSSEIRGFLFGNTTRNSQ